MLSLIIPVYKNEASLTELLKVIESLNKQIVDFEAVFVVDGSPDRCYEILRDSLPNCLFNSRLILFSKNFGSFSAIRAGLEVAKGKYFTVMAADLQEPPELIITIWNELLTNELDIIVATRKTREDSLLTRLPSNIFWGLYRCFVVREVPLGGVDIFGCNLIFRDHLLMLEERHSSLIAQIFWLGFRKKFVEYKRLKRCYGKSGWTLRKKIDYFMDSVFAFTDLPIKLLIRTGGFGTIFIFVFGCIIFVSRLLGIIEVPGYAATTLLIMFFGTLNLFAFGIIGSYAWRTYENTKARPLHAILSSHEFISKPFKSLG